VVGEVRKIAVDEVCRTFDRVHTWSDVVEQVNYLRSDKAVDRRLNRAVALIANADSKIRLERASTYTPPGPRRGGGRGRASFFTAGRRGDRGGDSEW